MTKNKVTGEQKVVDLLQHLVALELWRGGVPQAQIAKKLGVATSTVSGMLKGVARHVDVSKMVK